VLLHLGPKLQLVDVPDELAQAVTAVDPVLDLTEDLTDLVLDGEVRLRNNTLRSREISTGSLTLLSKGAAEASESSTRLPNRRNIHRLRPGAARAEF